MDTSEKKDPNFLSKTINSSNRCEPIAIVGMACRFPGGIIDMDSFWNFLSKGKDAITEIPTDRWNADRFYDPHPGTAGKYYTRYGGFIAGIHDFDAGFFRISPREAERMDPHQKLLLETAWEALEDAGKKVDRENALNAGVFIGVSNQDFTKVHSSLLDIHESSIHTATGISFSIAANRISFCLNLDGPSLALDTACSSSLVAVHLACQSVIRDECEMALAGGANVILSPDSYTSFSQLSMLSPGGRCKAFDERADGYVRGEGAGLVVLKKFSKAIEGGDRIYALIRGTGVNQDAQTLGLTIPNELAQEQLIEHVLRTSGINPASVGYVETHGTGTAVGDPIEAAAIGRAIGSKRSFESPCLIGSVKTNIGHLESAAGIAGLIKTVLVLRKKKIPPNLHFLKPNPKIDFKGLHLKVPVRLLTWPKNSPLVAAVNSFGFGGTNALAVLSPPLEESKKKRILASPKKNRTELFCLSAHNQTSLRSAAEKCLSFLSGQEWRGFSLHEICGASFNRRTHLDTRLAVAADSKEKLSECLNTFLKGEAFSGMSTGQILPPDKIKIAFVFSGQGPQWWAMGRELMEEEPVYRNMILKCDALLRQWGEWSLFEELNANEGASRLDKTSIAQPAIFALQAGLLDLWKSLGIRPDAVVGHSVGEVTAAYAAGVLSLEDALKVIFHRGRCMEYAASSKGRMLAVGLSESDVRHFIRDYGKRVLVGAVNSPDSVTLTGDAEPLEKIEQKLLADGVFCRFLKTKYAFHSHHMDGMKEELLSSLKGIETRPAVLPVYSSLRGTLAERDDFGVSYWWHNVRKQVRFAEAIGDLIRKDFNFFLEISPHPVLSSAVTEGLLHLQKRGSVLTSLKRNQSDSNSLLSSLGLLHSRGVAADLKLFYPNSYSSVPLPTLTWGHEKRTYLSELHRNFLFESPDFPLLGSRISAPVTSWENRINGWMYPFLKDHKIGGQVILPSTFFIEIGLSIAHLKIGREDCLLEDLAFHKVAFLPERKNLLVRASYDPENLSYRIHTAEDGQQESWFFCASGSVAVPSEKKRSKVSLSELKRRCPRRLSKEEIYSGFRKMGLDYGPFFQGIQHLDCGKNEALGKICFSKELTAGSSRYRVHPSVLDACFQVVVGAGLSDKRMSFLPVFCRRFLLFDRFENDIWSHAKIKRKSQETIEVDIQILDKKGGVLSEIEGLRLKGLESSRRAPETHIDDMLYGYEWVEKRRKRSGEAKTRILPISKQGKWLIFNDRKNLGRSMADLFRSRGDTCFLIGRGNSFQKRVGENYTIRPDSKSDIRHLLWSVVNNGRGEALKGILHFWGLDIPPFATLNTFGIRKSMRFTLLNILALVQESLSFEKDVPPKIFLVTRQAQPCGDPTGEVSPLQSMIWGMGRVVVNEFPRFECTLIDLDKIPDSPAKKKLETQQLFDEVLSFDEEDEVAFRGSSRYIHRLRRKKLLSGFSPSSREGEIENFRLEIPRPGVLDHLLFRQVERKPPGDGEIEVKVRAAGLNFSDVMKALNLYPGLADGSTPLGIEAAGVVVRRGGQVKVYNPGDRVMVLTPHSFSAYVTVPTEYVLPLPSSLDFGPAAALPLAFLTAYYSLVHLGRLKRGERVLIHSATGGVGLSAVQIAKNCGAEIFATAGTPEKRDYLRKMGILHVMDSRSLSFAAEILDKTNGEGVDVVLNSLAGEAISKGLSLLRDYGRFLEIGKRDIYQNMKVGLLPFRKNLAFFAIDLDKILKEQPSLIEKMLGALSQGLAGGSYSPLPLTKFKMDKAKDAFRYMAQAKHIGKIVLTLDSDQIPVAPADRTSVFFKEDATYLITGGFGGFGLTVARWLVINGARNVALIGRHGAPSSRIRQSLQRLGKKARILEILGDVSRKKDVIRALKTIQKSMPPLRGVFHAAAVLDDAALINMNPRRMFSVLGPKVLGAWHLHSLTKDSPLDFFVLFSSISSLIGMPGQGNYVAANSFLDGLSYFRTAAGFPSMSINWGYLGQVGIAARNKETVARFDNYGLRSFSPDQAMQLLARFLIFNPVQIGVMNMDWSRFGQILEIYKESKKFSDLFQRTTEGEKGTGKKKEEAFLQKLFLLSDSRDQLVLIETALLGQVAKILGTSSSKLSKEKPLADFGFDSLMAVELRNWLENNFNVTLPTLEVMRGPSISQLAKKIQTALRNSNP